MTQLYCLFLEQGCRYSGQAPPQQRSAFHPKKSSKFHRSARLCAICTRQLTLHMAAGSLALQDKLSVGVLSETVAMAMVVFDRTGPKHPKTSTLIGPQPVNFVHYDAQGHDDEEA